MMRKLFLFWYAVGLILMLTIGVPTPLAFSNGLFLVFYAMYAVSLEQGLRERTPLGWGRIAFVGLSTFGVEWLSVTTGWPFGEYNYTPVLGFLLGGVPVTIACAWVGVFLNGMLLSKGVNRWARALQTGLFTVTLDLVLDPVAYARGFWLWEEDGAYFGIPATNFISWFMISAALSLLFPVREISNAVRREAARLGQLMLLMFGVLGMKEGLYVPMLIAVAAAAVLEGVVIRYHYIAKKQVV
ncbi:carotenoid biosynthesis protein [Paenibacillus sp. KS-LC4]|uniref:carotenoid biosynthesis protein n=1 Tax=Paenibacillus sp. KS-LC4 TaxID=2979727 RepID=UPI0030D45897